MTAILDFGVRLIILLQGLGTWLETPMKFFSFLGTEDFFMVALPIIYWCYDTTLGIKVGLILMFSNSVNSCLKISFHGPRPYWISTSVKAFASETSFGLPSNHAQCATVLWGHAGYLPAEGLGLDHGRGVGPHDRPVTTVPGRSLPS